MEDWLLHVFLYNAKCCHPHKIVFTYLLKLADFQDSHKVSDKLKFR